MKTNFRISPLCAAFVAAASLSTVAAAPAQARDVNQLMMKAVGTTDNV